MWKMFNDFEIEKLLNRYRIQFYPKEKILLLFGPVKMDHFIKLKNYIRLFNIDIKEIIVK